MGRFKKGDTVRVKDDNCKENCHRYPQCKVNKGDIATILRYEDVLFGSHGEQAIIRSPSFGKMGSRPEHEIAINDRHLELIAEPAKVK